MNCKSNGRIFQANKIEEQSPEFTKVRDFVQFYREYLSFNWITSETIFIESIDLNIRRYQTPAFERYLNLTIQVRLLDSFLAKNIVHHVSKILTEEWRTRTKNRSWQVGYPGWVSDRQLSSIRPNYHPVNSAPDPSYYLPKLPCLEKSKLGWVAR